MVTQNFWYRSTLNTVATYSKYYTTLTAHFSTDSEQRRPQPLKQHNKSLSQSSLLLHSMTHAPGPVTLGQVRPSVMCKIA